MFLSETQNNGGAVTFVGKDISKSPRIDATRQNVARNRILTLTLWIVVIMNHSEMRAKGFKRNYHIIDFWVFYLSIAFVTCHFSWQLLVSRRSFLLEQIDVGFSGEANREKSVKDYGNPLAIFCQIGKLRVKTYSEQLVTGIDQKCLSSTLHLFVIFLLLSRVCQSDYSRVWFIHHGTAAAGELGKTRLICTYSS